MLFEVAKIRSYGHCAIGLNPYSNGICSLRREYVRRAKENVRGLNPYSNGICSLS